MMNEIYYTSITKEDALGLSLLDKECFSVPWSYNSFYNDAENKNAFYVLAKDENEIIGYVGYWKVLDEAMITNICVKSEYRKQKIASNLLSKIIEIAKNDELSSLSLEVRSSNYAAISLYEKFNFSNVGRRKNYYTNPTEDAILMQLDL